MVSVKRRNGKETSAASGKNCKWLVNGEDCALKIKANDTRDDVKYGGVSVYDDVSCAKCRYCGFEERVVHDMPETERTRLKDELSRLESALAKLKESL